MIIKSDAQKVRYFEVYSSRKQSCSSCGKTVYKGDILTLKYKGDTMLSKKMYSVYF